MALLRLPGTIGFKCWNQSCDRYDRFIPSIEALRDRNPLRRNCPDCRERVEVADWFAWRPWRGDAFAFRAPRGAFPMPTFMSFASEDDQFRDFFIGHQRQPNCPYRVIDHSAHHAFDEAWKRQMLPLIRSSDVTVMLIGPTTHLASGAIWEVETSLIEGIPAFGILIRRGLAAANSE